LEEEAVMEGARTKVKAAELFFPCCREATRTMNLAYRRAVSISMTTSAEGERWGRREGDFGLESGAREGTTKVGSGSSKECGR
jgi:hypothetical protein